VFHNRHPLRKKREVELFHWDLTFAVTYAGSSHANLGECITNALIERPVLDFRVPLE
jgi:hypothetical protein